MLQNKLLGQNFLKCHWVIDTLIKTADLKLSDTVLEIGPGTGVLTRELAKTAKKVVAVEKDHKLAQELDGELKKEGINNVEIVTGDILRTFSDLTKTYNLKPNSYKLVSNIPYYLTSRLLKSFLEERPQPETIVLTIQKEVAERICSKNKMSLLALSVQAFGRPKIIKIVPAECFWPKPKVDSAIIRISDISDNFFRRNKITSKEFFKVVRFGFSQKRKILANSLTQLTRDKKQTEKILQQAKIPLLTRPENLGQEDWVKIISLLK